MTDNWAIEYYDETITTHAQNLKNRSAASNLDLSLYEVGNLTTPRAGNKRVTANSYVVDRPGSFRFPLVYGNAIDWTKNLTAIKAEIADASAISVDPQTTGWNVYSYTDGKVDSNGQLLGPYINPASNGASYWHSFYRFDGNYITSPYILSDLGLNVADVEVAVLWEDVESAVYSMLAGRPSIGMDNVTGFKNSDGSDLSSMPYVHFEVPVGAINSDVKMDPFKRVTGIREGNILLALRTKNAVTVAGTEYPAGTIIWKWHIWISDEDLTAVRMKQRSGSALEYNDFLPIDMGFCNDNTFIYHDIREWYVKIKHADTASDAEPIVFKIVQERAKDEVLMTTGTHHQWGRMDPMPSIYQVFRKNRNEEWNFAANNFMGNHYYETVFKKLYSPDGYNTYVSSYSDYDCIVNGEFRDYGIQRARVFNITDWFQNHTLISTHPSSNNNYYTVPIDQDHQGYFANVWSNNTKTGTEDDDFKVYKTVYDPCPPGYSVPNRYAFSYFLNADPVGYQTQAGHTDRLNIVDVASPSGKEINDLLYWDENKHKHVAYFYTGYGDNTLAFYTLDAGFGNTNNIRTGTFGPSCMFPGFKVSNDAAENSYHTFESIIWTANGKPEAWSSYMNPQIVFRPCVSTQPRALCMYPVKEHF